MSGSDSTEIARISVSDIQVLADSIVKSKLFGLNNVHQAIALMALAQSEGIHPATAARDYHIVEGRPSMKAEVMLARFQAKGGTSKVVKYTDDGVTMEFHHPQGGSVTITWDLKRITAAKANGSPKALAMYKTNPAAMYRSRCISEGIRTVFPGVIIGVYAPEEMDDFKPAKVSDANIIDAEFEQTADVKEEPTKEPVTESQPQAKAERAKATSAALSASGTAPTTTPSPPPAKVADSATNHAESPAPSLPAASQPQVIDTSDFATAPPADAITAAQIQEIKELKPQLYAGLLAEMDAATKAGDTAKAEEFATTINTKWAAALAKRKVTTAKHLSQSQAAELIKSIAGVVAKMDAEKKRKT